MESKPNINNELTSPNLRSLKRPQLIKLAKANGIPGNGKNVELIDKLRAHRDLQLESNQELVPSHSTIQTREDSEIVEELSEVENEVMGRQDNIQGSESPIQEFAPSSGTSGLLRHVSSFRQLRAGERRDIGSSDCALSISAASEQSGSGNVSLAGDDEEAREVDVREDVEMEIESEDGDQTLEAIPTLSNNILGLTIYRDSPPNRHPTSNYKNQIIINMEVESPSQAFPFGSASSTPNPFPEIPRGTTRIGQLAPPTPPTPQYFEFGTSKAQNKRFSFGGLSTSTAIPNNTNEISNFLPVATGSSQVLDKGKGKQTSTTDQIMEELNARMELNRSTNSMNNSSGRNVDEFGGLNKSTSLFSLRDGLTPSNSSMNLSLSTGTSGKGKGTFDGQHKRNFDKMDSISTHYAAKRPLSHSTSSRSIGPSGSADIEAETDSSRKRVKLLSSSVSSNTLSKPISTNTLKASTSSKSIDKKLVDGLRETGWSSSNPRPAAAVHSSLASSVPTRARGFSFSSSVRSRPNLVDKEAEAEKLKVENKRKLDMAKNRRLGSTASTSSSILGGASKRRTDNLVNKSQTKTSTTGNAATRMIKSTIQKIATTIAPSAPSVVRKPSTLTSTSASTSTSTLSKSTSFGRNLSKSTSNRSLAPSATSGFNSTSSTRNVATATKAAPTKVEPGWKKFDLQKSLSKPLGRSVSSNKKPAASDSSTGPSNIARPTISRSPSVSRSISSSPVTITAPQRRRQSSRAVNPITLQGHAGTSTSTRRDSSPVLVDQKAQAIHQDTEQDESEIRMEAVDEEQENHPQYQHHASTSALTAPATLLVPVVNSIASNIFPSLAGNTSKPLPLIPPSPIKSSFRPRTLSGTNPNSGSNLRLVFGERSNSTGSNGEESILVGGKSKKQEGGRITRGSLAGSVVNLAMNEREVISTASKIDTTVKKNETSGHASTGGRKLVSSTSRAVKNVAIGGVKKVGGLDSRAKKVVAKKSKVIS